MVEPKIREVTIFEHETSWTDACAAFLAKNGITASIRPPFSNLVEEDEVSGKVSILPMPIDDIDRLDIGVQVWFYGGVALVLGDRRNPGIDSLLSISSRAIYVGQKGLDFRPLLRTIIRLPSRNLLTGIDPY